MNRKFVIFVILLMLVSVSAFTQSVVTEPVGFQGRLAKPDGTPVADGNYSLTFSAYNAATGGTLLWQQVSSAVPVHNGAFSVKLDFTTGLQNGSTFATIFTNSVPYLEIKVGNDAPLTPRQKFTSHAYAYLANSVPNGSIGLSQLANGLLNFSNIGGTIGANQIAAGSITGSQIASGAVTATNLSSSLQQTLTLLSGSTVSLAGSIGTGSVPSSVAVAGSYTYVVSEVSRVLQVFDTTDPTNPVLKGSRGTSLRPLSVAVQGSYAYVVCGDGQALQIFDVSNPVNPVLTSSIGIGGYPNAIVTQGSYAYVTNGGSNALQIFDISNPASPVLKGAASTSTGSQTPNLAVAGGYAYVVNEDSDTFQIFDVSNPASPVLKGSVGTSAKPASVAIVGGLAYVTSYNGRTLQVFDVSNPNSPSLKNSVATGTAAFGLAISGNFACVTSLSNQLQIFDISNPTAITLLVSIGTDSNPVSAVAAGGSIYVVNRSSSTLQIFKLPTITINGPLTVAGLLTAANGIAFGDGTKQTSAGLTAGSAAGGDLTGTYPNPTIAANAITTTKIADGSITAAKIAAGTLPTALPPNGVAGGDLTGTYPGPALATQASSLTKVSGNVMNSINGRIGINTLTPAGLLDVTGNVFMGASTLDQSQTTQNGGAGSLSQWQSFTAGLSGYMNRIDLNVSSPLNTQSSPGTISVYTGEGTSGTLLATQAVTYQPVLNTFQTFTLTAPPLLTAGQKYTFSFSAPAMTVGWVSYALGSNPYLNGRSSFGPNDDCVFRTYVTPGTNGSILLAQNGGNVSVGSNLAVGGSITASSATVPTLNGAVNVTGSISASSATVPTLNGAVNVTGSLSAPSANIASFNLDQRFSSLAVAGGFVVDKNGNNHGNNGDPILYLGSIGGEGIGSNHDLENLDFYTGFMHRMTITGGGYVGIGTQTPAFRLELPNVNSNDGKGRANAWVTYSSGRWKNHITPIEDPLEKVLNMRGVMFDWLPEFGGGHDIGFVAEEAGAIVPELAVWEKDGKFAQGLKYDRVSALLVEAVKTLNTKMEDKKKEIEELKTKVNALETQNEAMKKQNARLAELEKQLAALAEAMQKMQAQDSHRPR